MGTQVIGQIVRRRVHFRGAMAVWFGLLVQPAPAAEAPPPAVATVVVQSGASEGGFELDATLQPVRQSTVAAQVGGNVLALAVKAGDHVKAGQLLARIDEREAQAGLLRSEAGVAQAQAEWRNARSNAERTRDLRAQGFVSQSALDVAETQLKAAQAGLQQAQAGQSQARLARGFSVVNAPFDAVVLATHVEAGELATPGRPLVTLYVPSLMRVVVQVPASRSDAARAAQRIEVQLPDGRWVAPSTRISLPSADAVSQTVEWRLDLSPALSAGLQPGRTVPVRFSGGSSGPAAAARLSVPKAAVLRRGELTAVYVAQEGQFVLRAVRLGVDRGADAVEVLVGLASGERVALDPVRAGLAGATVAP